MEWFYFVWLQSQQGERRAVVRLQTSEQGPHTIK